MFNYLNLVLAFAPLNDKKLGTVEGCSPEQTSRLENEQQDFENQLTQLKIELGRLTFDYIKESYIIPENRDDSNHLQQKERYERYRRSLFSKFDKMHQETRLGINIKCSKQHLDRYCRGNDTLAYVLFRFGQVIKKVNFCELYFSNSSRTSAETFFHELSHYAANTEDFAGDWINPKNLDLDRAAQDAYHLESFLDVNLEDKLRRTIWPFLWKRR